MKINIFSLLILATAAVAFSPTLFAQGGVSSNLEPHRSYMLPSSSSSEALSDKSSPMRYAIPVGEWSESKSGMQSTFESSFATPFSWTGRQYIISIERASAPYTLFVGEKQVGQNINVAMPAQFNITKYLKSEVETPITIVMKPDATSSELSAWQSGTEKCELGRVVMLSQPTMYIRDVGVETERISGVLNSTVSIVVKSELLNPRSSRINYELLSPRGDIVSRGHSDLSLSMRGEDTVRVFAIIPDSLAWSAENPNLYRLNLSTQYRGRYAEYYSFEIGLRSLERDAQGDIMVNGIPQKLNAVEVNSSISAEDISALKSKGYNTVKVAAGEYNRELYAVADSIGLYVITTAPINTSRSGDNILRGGNPTNDPDRHGEYIERVDAMFRTTRIHPSVIAYALADSSLNGINLYESYLYLKKEESQRPIIYLDAQGQWNSDRIRIDF